MQRHLKNILRDLQHKVNNKMANHDKIERLGLFVKIISNVLEEKKMEHQLFLQTKLVYLQMKANHTKKPDCN